MSNIIAEIEFRYDAIVRLRGRRARRPVRLRERIPVALRVAGATECPIAVLERNPRAPMPVVEIRHDGSGFFSPIAMRTYDGRTQPLDVDTFLRSLREGGAPYGDPMITDNPFAVREMRDAYARPACAGEAGIAEILQSNVEESRVRARRTAAEDILVIDGVVHRRTGEPVYDVARAGAEAGGAALEPARSDMLVCADSLVAFRADDRAGALRFATELSAGLAVDAAVQFEVLRQDLLKADAVHLNRRRSIVSLGHRRTLPDAGLEPPELAAAICSVACAGEKSPEAVASAWSALGAILRDLPAGHRLARDFAVANSVRGRLGAALDPLSARAFPDPDAEALSRLF